MASRKAPNTGSAISTTAAWLAIGATLSYQFLLLELIVIRPDLDPSWHTISEWAIGPHGWIMTGAFLISGMSYAALFVMLQSQLRGLMGRIGLGLLGLCVLGAVGVGVFQTDPMPFRFPLTTDGTFHVISETSQLIFLPVAALIINVGLARHNQAWGTARKALFWSAGLPVSGFAAFALYTAVFVIPLGPQAHGPGVNVGWPPRFAFFTYTLWIVILGWLAIRCSRHGGTGADFQLGSYEASPYQT